MPSYGWFKSHSKQGGVIIDCVSRLFFNSKIVKNKTVSRIPISVRLSESEMGQPNEFGQAGQRKETFIGFYDYFPLMKSKLHTM